MVKRMITPIVSVPLCLAAAAAVPASRPASRPATRRTVDTRAFELTPTPPPTPALRYQLTTSPADRRPGNAAQAYLEAALTVSAEQSDAMDKAVDAEMDRHDNAAFAAIIGPLFGGRSETFVLLDQASRYDRCNWDLPVSSLQYTPWLNNLRLLSNVLSCRTTFLTRAGRIDEAVETMRWQVELGRAVGRGSVVVNGLVGDIIYGGIAPNLPELMDRPDAPNLYWALRPLCRPVVPLADAVRGDRAFLLSVIPVLAKGRSGGITADDWRAYAEQCAAFAALQPYVVTQAGNPPQQSGPTLAETVRTANAGAATLLPESSAYYARTRRLSAAEAAKVDPQLLAATYLIEQDQAASDEAAKLLDLPYPQLMPRWAAVAGRLRELGITAQSPSAVALPFFRALPVTFAMTERRFAALTAVEALRSYAAAHDGQLPQQLANVTDTPVPDNPVTGKPFEYRVENGVATLEDHDPLLADWPLEYTVRIRR